MGSSAGEEVEELMEETEEEANGILEAPMLPPKNEDSNEQSTEIEGVEYYMKWLRRNSYYVLPIGVILILLVTVNVYFVRSGVLAGMGWGDQFSKPRKLTYYRKGFRLNGREFRVYSGSVDYFRMVPTEWQRVLDKAKATGFNSIVTSVPWNMHEPEPGEYMFQGLLNITEFLEQCELSGLMVILKVGPFVGAELDFGGLPGWLLYDDREMRVRDYNAAFLDRVDRFHNALAEKVRPFGEGRPLIAMQLEHNLGSFGDSPEYVSYLKTAWIKRGFESQLFFTLDTPDGVQNTAPVPGVLKSISIQKDTVESFRKLRTVQPTGPLFAAELKIGDCDKWGDVVHFTRENSDVLRLVKEVVVLRASLNVHMFAGGSTFGMYNGAMIDSKTKKHYPYVSSHDYDGIVDETKNLRRVKYEVVAGVLSSQGFSWVPETLEEFSITTSDYVKVLELEHHAPLLDVLDVASPYEPVRSEHPLHMELVNGASLGFVLYRHVFAKDEKRTGKLVIEGVGDRAYVILNGNTEEIFARNDDSHEMTIEKNSDVLDILVENMGRPSTGGFALGDKKGILGDVSLDGNVVTDWFHHRISLENSHEMWPDVLNRTVIKEVSNRLVSSSLKSGNWRTPMFFRGSFVIPKGIPYLHCAFLKIEGHGMAWVNGFPIGRFWAYKGPEQTLFVPSDILNEGRNRIVVLQLEPDRFSGKVWFSPEPILGEPLQYDAAFEKFREMQNRGEVEDLGDQSEFLYLNFDTA
eukprot:CAMPEP_0113968460 /NCGR_PEP_ID=MMETSP0011_2-20120614/9552_1 /TAXON_ID=101924 /ORGANISM="Rhodosorus marinus" /LENGTH=745 /DNA_ID=CAMNT_0000981565 /DNA_START=42 /DNA_END=2279 /DNA_ORIENTATION=- /assembly_acc=CAM_ASM_000156